MLPWNTLATYLRNKYKVRVQKIPLDFNSACPNRDGNLSSSGCIFCNLSGAGSGLLAKGSNLSAQWDFWHTKYNIKNKAKMFLAYFQSYSNTYCSTQKLQLLLEQTTKLKNIIGLSLGTRPDCLDEEKLQLIADCKLSEVWLELGLQSMHNRTLKRINRQHTAEQSEQAIWQAHAHGIKVIGHLMAGLPDESLDDFLDSVHWASSLPLHGLKLHSTFVSHNTKLALEYASGKYKPLTQEQYVQAIVHALTIIPEHIIIHRLTGDPSPDELIAPSWNRHKTDTLNNIQQYMQMYKLSQGCYAHKNNYD